jgi:hypothetical protein
MGAHVLVLMKSKEISQKRPDMFKPSKASHLYVLDQPPQRLKRGLPGSLTMRGTTEYIVGRRDKRRV